jgi:hypothetical protein
VRFFTLTPQDLNSMTFVFWSKVDPGGAPRGPGSSGLRRPPEMYSDSSSSKCAYGRRPRPRTGIGTVSLPGWAFDILHGKVKQEFR